MRLLMHVFLTFITGGAWLIILLVKYLIQK